MIYGSLGVVAALQAIKMIAEYHLLVHPTAIGEGEPLFPPEQSPVGLRLRSAEAFRSGAALMRHEPAIETAPP